MNHSILLVEDDAEIATALADVLRDEGYQVAVASDGSVGLERLERDPLPDVVLLDVVMPRIDGLEFRRRQLMDPRLAGIPTVVLSASTLGANRARMTATVWLPKPFDADDLLAVVANLCRASRQPTKT